MCRIGCVRNERERSMLERIRFTSMGRYRNECDRNLGKESDEYRTSV